MLRKYWNRLLQACGSPVGSVARGLLFFGLLAMVAGCAVSSLGPGVGQEPVVASGRVAEAGDVDHFAGQLENASQDKDVAFQYLMGFMHLREHRYKEAEEAFTRVAEFDPRTVEVREIVAQLATQRGDLEKATLYARSALALDRTREGTRLLLASLLRTLQKLPEAAEQYEFLIQSKENSDQVRLLLAPLYGLMKNPVKARQILEPLFNKPGLAWRAHLAMGRVHIDQDDDAKALAAFQEARRLEPDQIEPVLALGSHLQKMNRQAEAEKIYRDYLSGNPGSRVVHTRLGRLMLTLDKRQEALEQFQAVTRIAPESIQARLTTALILLSQGAFQEALKELRMAQAIQPDNSGILYYLGQALEATQQRDEAAKIFEKIPKGEPFYMEAQIRLAYHESTSGKGAAAVERVHRLVGEFGDKSEVFLAASVLLLQEKDYAGVVEMATRGIVIDPAQTRLIFNRAMAYDKLKRWEEAEKDLLNYLEVNPEDAQALNYLGYSWADRNEKLDKSYEYLQKAVKLAPGDGFITDSLGWVLFRLNRLQEALSTMREAVRLEPKDPTINEHLGDVLLANGQVQEALLVWQKALELDADNHLLREKIQKHAQKVAE
ncbi:MAG: tetratricopeptide repeat protein [Magnetococcales bacterium]|nr:tetratricopeptide repeat protein [Magnetococcales bacterium]